MSARIQGLAHPPQVLDLCCLSQSLTQRWSANGFQAGTQSPIWEQAAYISCVPNTVVVGMNSVKTCTFQMITVWHLKGTMKKTGHQWKPRCSPTDWMQGAGSQEAYSVQLWAKGQHSSMMFCIRSLTCVWSLEKKVAVRKWVLCVWCLQCAITR